MPSAPVQIQVYSSSNQFLGFVSVQLPDDQFQEILAKYPPEGFTGQNRKVNEAIRDGITKEEAERIARHLDLSHDSKLKFELYAGIPQAVDHAKPTFEMDGRKFWILP